MVPARLARAMSLPKHAQAAALVRAQVADGTLPPGKLAPSGEAPARMTGYSAPTCRRALRALRRRRAALGQRKEWSQQPRGSPHWQADPSVYP